MLCQQTTEPSIGKSHSRNPSFGETSELNGKSLNPDDPTVGDINPALPMIRNVP